MAAKKATKTKSKKAKTKATQPAAGKYELVTMIAGKATPAKKKQLEETVRKLVGVIDGEVLNIEDWGERDLSYEIAGESTGSFLIFSLDLGSDKVSGFSEKIKLEPQVDRYLLLRKEK